MRFWRWINNYNDFDNFGELEKMVERRRARGLAVSGRRSSMLEKIQLPYLGICALDNKENNNKMHLRAAISEIFCIILPLFP